MYATSFALRDTKMRNTALLAAEAVGGSEILATVLKEATNRTRPSGVTVGGNYSDTFFDRGKLLSNQGGFPSGHTIAAFSVATVVARRYRNHKWVPYAAYGLAGAVGFSRVSLSAHFVSDVFAGAALGYSISRFAVLRE
jgi:membrane-associated phospholipid phosphatase